MFEARLPARKFEGYVCVGNGVGGGKVVEEDLSTTEKVWADPKAAAEQVIAVS